MAARSALEVLQYVHPVQDRPSARARYPDRSLDAMDMLAMVDDAAGEWPLARSAAQLIQLLPRRGRTSNQKRRRLKVLQQTWKRSQAEKQLEAQARRFNLSGRAVTADDLMVMPGSGHVT